MPIDRNITIQYHSAQQLWRAHFRAMGSVGEILVDAPHNAKNLGATIEAAAREVWRIEDKYSRYQTTSVISHINQHTGFAQLVDAETTELLNFADQCYQLSEGLFDVTSGRLRELWRFGSDGHTQFPSAQQVSAVTPYIGWPQVQWSGREITLPHGMEIDFGGIVKEYAVDRTLLQLSHAMDFPCLVNLGGDLRCSQARKNNTPWVLGIENPDSVQDAIAALSLHAGALATSGDTRRFFLHNGQRYGHILNPITGYPVAGAPRSVTVAAPTCTEAGVLSTLAMLQGNDAELFLQAQGVPHWVIADR